MDMLKGEQIAEANLTDWRKPALGHPRASIGTGYVDLELISDDASYRAAGRRLRCVVRERGKVVFAGTSELAGLEVGSLPGRD
jgi:hypothetical protein